jgi:uncharacterized protein (DUF433 family)
MVVPLHYNQINMTTFDEKPIISLGTGIYTMPDVAAILDLPLPKVRRWFRSYWAAQFGESTNTRFSEGEGRELVVNFHTLIEFYVFYCLRESGVSVQRIVNAHKILEERLKTPHPFATATILAEQGGRILFDEIGQLIRADKSLQLVIRQFIEPFCRNIEFGSDKLAKTFYPLGRESSIVVDPRRRFGQPVISNTNITPDTVFGLHRAGESNEFIGRIYDLTAKQVADAIAYNSRNAA